MGILLGVDTLCYHCRLVTGNVTHAEVFSEISELGAQFVQLNSYHLRDLAPADIDKLRGQAESLGLGITLAGTMVGVVSLNLNEIIRSSLAIPIECFASYRDELLRHGRVVSRPQRAWLGVFAHPLDEGVVVAGLVPNGPGARSGVQEGDVIVGLDSREVPTRKDLYLTLWRHSPGEKISMEVLRDNELRVVNVVGGDRAEFYKQG